MNVDFFQEVFDKAPPNVSQWLLSLRGFTGTDVGFKYLNLLRDIAFLKQGARIYSESVSFQRWHRFENKNLLNKIRIPKTSSRSAHLKE